ncbi:alkaline phosphatase [Longibacter salinarum]|uniref:Alkaline phosphatase n=1 Tax=Longibacter salinarum TaxID=1850348 RepID=A0A2A8D0T5_9BACT|nr:alkaline phosphatase D family protein [Longibacter salinarum]PEN14258.1 alkaline phosphatase [Longibacter salinarum]
MASSHICRLRLLAMAVLVAWPLGCQAPESPQTHRTTTSSSDSVITRIAFGSCNNQRLKQPLWSPIGESSPDLWIWMGDNIYADTENMAKMEAEYDHQKSQPGYEALREKAHVLGTWDDHDYGVNDGDRTYAKRDSSQQLFLDFLGVSADSPRRDRKGVYSSHTFGPPGKQVKIVLLDTRFHRDPLTKLDTPSRLYAPDSSARLLGEEQWRWLEQELRESEARVNLIGTSIQAIGTEHRWEKWADVPAERDRLFRTIRESGASGVILLSGDRHRGELSRHDTAIGYPLYELTSSGLTHTTPAPGEVNKHRVGDLVEVLHYGRIDLSFEAPDPHVLLELRGRKDTLLLRERVSLSSLKPALN